MKQFFVEEKAQVIVEYVLMLAMAVTVVGSLGYGLKKILLYLWKQISCDVSAACPHCPATDQVKNAGFGGSCR